MPVASCGTKIVLHQPHWRCVHVSLLQSCCGAPRRRRSSGPRSGLTPTTRKTSRCGNPATAVAAADNTLGCLSSGELPHWWWPCTRVSLMGLPQHLSLEVTPACLPSMTARHVPTTLTAAAAHHGAGGAVLAANLQTPASPSPTPCPTPTLLMSVWQDYFEFDGGSARAAAARGISTETQQAISRWLEENK